MYEHKMSSRQEEFIISDASESTSIFQEYVLSAQRTPADKSAVEPSMVTTAFSDREKNEHPGDRSPNVLENKTTNQPGDQSIKAEDAAKTAMLKTGAEAVSHYLSDLPKLAAAVAGDLETNFELMLVWKDSSIKVKEQLKENTPAYVSVMRTELVFRPTDPAEKSWELRFDTFTGEATALRFNSKTLKMEPAEAGPLIESVSLTLRAAMVIKCFRDGDIDLGRERLKTLLEDGRKLGAEDRLKKIINTEADLIYKPARLRAVTRADFSKILAEAEIALKKSEKR